MAEVELDKLIIHFAQSNKAEGKSSRAVSWYSEMLYDFTRFLRSKDYRRVLHEFDIGGVRAFVVHEQERGMSPYTVQGKVRALKAFSTWLFREGYTSDNLLSNFKLPKVPVTIIETLTSTEIDQLVNCQNQLTAIGCRDIAILIVMLNTGVRLSELCGLRLEDAHIEEGYLKVMGKGSRESNRLKAASNFGLQLPNRLKLLEINQTAFSYVFNLNSGLNSRRHWIETTELNDTNPIQGYWNLTKRFASIT